jgi:hypothetical protein
LKLLCNAANELQKLRTAFNERETQESENSFRDRSAGNLRSGSAATATFDFFGSRCRCANLIISGRVSGLTEVFLLPVLAHRFSVTIKRVSIFSSIVCRGRMKLPEFRVTAGQREGKVEFPVGTGGNQESFNGAS